MATPSSSTTCIRVRSTCPCRSRRGRGRTWARSASAETRLQVIGDRSGPAGGRYIGSARPTRLYLVRHGQSEANVTWEFSYRRVDPPLTERGLRQVNATAEYLASLDVDGLYSSPMTRALQTAEIFGRAL